MDENIFAPIFRIMNLEISDLQGLYGFDFSPTQSRLTGATKNLVRKKFGNICVLCGKKQDIFDRAFPVHHINYDKMNNAFFNLVLLCAKCHANTNSNRVYWTNYFYKLLL